MTRTYWRIRYRPSLSADSYIEDGIYYLTEEEAWEQVEILADQAAQQEFEVYEVRVHFS